MRRIRIILRSKHVHTTINWPVNRHTIIVRHICMEKESEHERDHSVLEPLCHCVVSGDILTRDCVNKDPSELPDTPLYDLSKEPLYLLSEGILGLRSLKATQPVKQMD